MYVLRFFERVTMKHFRFNYFTVTSGILHGGASVMTRGRRAGNASGIADHYDFGCDGSVAIFDNAQRINIASLG